jgi:hypothetical protein
MSDLGCELGRVDVIGNSTQDLIIPLMTELNWIRVQ